MALDKIYTKTGDAGTTSLVGGERVTKDCLRLESYGTIDELNSMLGLLASQLPDGEWKQCILHIQSCLFVVGGNLATHQEERTLSDGCALPPSETEYLEKMIDKMQAFLPPIPGFILPGGSQQASVCHVCRTICRRAERHIVALSRQAHVDEAILQYINRLSDFLFVMARNCNFMQNQDEIIWQNCCR